MNEPTIPDSTGIRREAFLGLLAATGIGILIRLWGLAGQVIGGDEMHAVHAALDSSFPEVLYTYRPSDHCIPLTSFFRFLLDCGFTLTEWLLRLPSLMASALVIYCLPRLLVPILGGPAAVGLAWWLALSPTFIYYSRIVRSYAIIILLGNLAMIAFYAYLERRVRGSRPLFVLAAALTVYFHPVAGPYIVGMFVFALAEWLVSYRTKSRLLPIVWAGLGFAGGVALFLLPGWSSLHSVLGMKQNSGMISWATLQGVMTLQAGGESGWLTWFFWLFALLGVVALGLRRPRVVLYALTVVACLVLGVWWVSPLGSNQPIILNRYLIIGLPVVLTLVATGGDWLVSSWRSQGGRCLVAIGLPLFWVLLGPLGPGKENLLGGSFAQQAHRATLEFRKTAALEVPAAYEWVASRGPNQVVAEMPWQFMWRYSRVYAEYQRSHGAEIVVVTVDPKESTPLLEFRNLSGPDPLDVLSSRATVLLVHLDIAAEERALDLAMGRKRRNADVERRDRRLGKAQRQTDRRLGRFEEVWGPPDYRSSDIVGWDLERVRRLMRGEL